MFEGLQVLGCFGMGLLLIIVGIARLRSAAPQGRFNPWLLILFGILALLWWPFVFWEESSRTHIDSEGGKYIEPRR